MDNMRRQALRMADGGSFITRWANNVMKPAQGRLRQMDAPPVVAQAPAQTAAPVTAENPAGIRFADGGLRGDPYRKGSMDGGRVVGPGGPVDDMVEAAYSRDEYVLPADTALAIGHENLDAIKDATHVPAAVQRRYDLRSQGGQHGQEQNGLGERQDGIPRRAEGRVGVADVAGLDDQGRGAVRDRVHPLEQVGRSQTLRLADGGIPGMDVLERPWAGAQDARTFAQQPGPGNPNIGANGSAQAQSFRASTAPAVAPGVPVSPATAPRSTLRAGMAAQPAALSKSTFAAGRAVDGIAKLASGPLGRLAGGAGVAANFNDYKINDPDVDSSAAGTWNALRSGDFSGAGRSLSKGALETGMDLGSAVANTADYLVPGKAPVSTAYNNMLRNQFGDQLAPHASVTAQASAASAPTTPSLRAGASPAPAAPSSAGDATMPGQDPGRVSLRGQAGADVLGAPGVSKFVQGGKTLYSNVPGADNDKLMSNNPGVSTIPGMSQALIDRTLTNPDGSRWSESDSATMSANLRDGADAYRGTSRDSNRNGGDLMSRIAKQGPNHAVASLLANQQNTTALRGQDVQLSGQQMTAATARNAARIDQMNKDRGYNLDVQKFGEEKAKTMFDQRQKATKDLHEEIGTMLPPGPDGKPDLNTASRYAVGLNASVAGFQKSLETKAAAGDAKAVAALADFRKRGGGVAGLDEVDKRAFINSMKVKDLAEQYHTSRMNPAGGTAVATDAPRTGLRKLSDGFFGFGGEYTTDQGDEIPARAIERENGEFFGGKRRVDLRQ